MVNKYSIGVGLGLDNTTETNPFSFSPVLIEKGWDGVFEELVKPAYAAGFRYMFLHRPFGESDTKDNADFDTRIDIREQTKQFNYIISDSAVMRFLNKVEKYCPGMVLNMYFGSFEDDDFNDRFQKSSFAAWINRATQSLGAILNSPICDITFDGASHYDVGDPRYHFIRMVGGFKESQGRQIVIEPVGTTDEGRNFDLPALCLDSYWNNLIEQENPWTIIRFSDEIYIWWNNVAVDNNAFDNDMFAWAQHLIDYGLNPVFDFHQWFGESTVYSDTPNILINGNFDLIDSYQKGQWDAVVVPAPGKPDDMSPGKPVDVEPGKPDDVEPGKPDDVEPGKPAPSKPDDMSPSKPDDMSPSKRVEFKS